MIATRINNRLDFFRGGNVHCTALSVKCKELRCERTEDAKAFRAKVCREAFKLPSLKPYQLELVYERVDSYNVPRFCFKFVLTEKMRATIQEKTDAEALKIQEEKAAQIKYVEDMAKDVRTQLYKLAKKGVHKYAQKWCDSHRGYGYTVAQQYGRKYGE